jgi:hypothetical protein
LANFIIRESKKSRKGVSEYILLLIHEEETFYGTYGIIDKIINAYNNVDFCSEDMGSSGDASEIQMKLNFTVRNNILSAARSILHATQFFLVSQLAYKEYAKKGSFYDEDFQYIVTVFDEEDPDGDIKWEMAMRNKGGDITRGIKEWMKFRDSDTALQHLLHNIVASELINKESQIPENIKGSIYLGEIEPTLLSTLYRDIGSCPCDTCIVRSACVNIDFPEEGYKVRKIWQDNCEDRPAYVTKVSDYFLQKLSPDKDLQDLLEYVCNDIYFPNLAPY